MTSAAPSGPGLPGGLPCRPVQPQQLPAGQQPVCHHPGGGRPLLPVHEGKQDGGGVCGRRAPCCEQRLSVNGRCLALRSFSSKAARRAVAVRGACPPLLRRLLFVFHCASLVNANRCFHDAPVQTIERAHTPKNLWQKIRLKRQYVKVSGGCLRLPFPPATWSLRPETCRCWCRQPRSCSLAIAPVGTDTAV